MARPGRRILALQAARWIRADEREQRGLDRTADRAEATGEGDDLARYNDFLRRANAAATDGSGTRQRYQAPTPQVVQGF